MIQAEWDSPDQRYISMTFAGRWTWEEVDLAIAQARQLVIDLERPFCLVIHLIDDTARSHVPRNVFAYASMSHRVSPYTSKTIIVNSNSIGAGIMSIVFRLHPQLRQYYVFVSSMDEAERLISPKYEEQ